MSSQCSEYLVLICNEFIMDSMRIRLSDVMQRGHIMWACGYISATQLSEYQERYYSSHNTVVFAHTVNQQQCSV